MNVRVSVVVPMGPSVDVWRAKALAILRGLYRECFPSWPMLTVVDTNRARARNTGMAEAVRLGAEVVILNDMDSLVHPAPLKDAVELCSPGGKIPAVYPWDSYSRLSHDITSTLSSWREAWEVPVAEELQSCSAGCVVLQAGVAHRVRFDNCLPDAFEDLDFYNRLTERYVQPPKRLAGELVHLWHPRPAVEPQDNTDARRLFERRWGKAA